MALTNQTTIVHTQSATDKNLLNTPATNIPISASNSMRIDVFEDYNRSYVKTTSTGVLCAVSLFEWLDGTKSYYKDGPLTFGTTVLYSDINCTTPLINTEYSTGIAHIKTSNTGVVSGWFEALLYDYNSYDPFKIYEPYIKKGTILYQSNSAISAKHLLCNAYAIPTNYNEYANPSTIFKNHEYLFGSRSINYFNGNGLNSFVISISTDNTGAVTHISNKDASNYNNEYLYTTSSKFAFPSQNRYSFGPQITAYSDENLTTLYSPGVLTTNYFVESKNVYYQLNIDNNGILKYNYFNFTDSTNTNYYTKGGFKDQFYPFILQEGMRLFNNAECTTSVSNITAIFGVPLSVSAVQVVTSPVEGIITNINELLPYTLGATTFYYASSNNYYFVTLSGTQAPNMIGVAAGPVGIFNVDSSVADQFKITNGTITWNPSAGFAPADGGFYFTNSIGSFNNLFPESGYSTVYDSNAYQLVIGPLSGAVIFNSTGQAFDSAGQSLLANQLYLFDINEQSIVRFTIMSNTVTNPGNNHQYYSTIPLSGALTLFDGDGSKATFKNFDIGADVNGDGAYDSITTDGSGLITLNTTTLYGTSIAAGDNNTYYTNNLSTGGTLYNGPYSNANTVGFLVSYYTSSGTTYKIETDTSGVMTITQVNTFTLNGTAVYYLGSLTSGSTTLYTSPILDVAVSTTSGTQDIDSDGNNDDYTVTGGTISWTMVIVYDQSWNGYYHTGTLTNGTTVLYNGQGSGAGIVVNASGNYDFGSGETGWSTDGSGVISWT